MAKISVNDSKILPLVELLRRSNVPPEKESVTHSFVWAGDLRELANCYFAIVAICHQTSPIGERRLEGSIDNVTKYGWDYLKEKFLKVATTDSRWSSCKFWSDLTPNDLSKLYEDKTMEKTLNRINERTFLLNDLGKQLMKYGYTNIKDAFLAHQQLIGGEKGFLRFLKEFEAYKDPVQKKSLFFLSIMAKECDWQIVDISSLSSPVDYHELRGHLRIGTIRIEDGQLLVKIQKNLVLSESEDVELRTRVQEANDRLAKEAGLTSSIIHYLFWNTFRCCCPRESYKTHCQRCVDQCSLPEHYKTMSTYQNRCIFSNVCESANKQNKVIDPPYMGHYY